MNHRIKFVQTLILLVAIMTTYSIQAQENEKGKESAINEFHLDAKIMTRGEIRAGGFEADEDDKKRIAHFIMGQYRINLGYKRSDWFELRLSPQMSCVWGQSSVSLTLAEAWASFRSKQGFFGIIGRQVLEYDDERILGYDDWTMTAPTHDVLRFGYEGHGHKVHALLAYNQDSDNMDIGGSYYSGGLQPYKSMQTLWYHYETPKQLFSFSVIGMNIGTQSRREDDPKNKSYYQQLVGGYITLKPSIVKLEGSFYYQFGKEELGIPIDAFMGNAKLTVTLKERYNIFAGYDYLSGDKYFAVPSQGTIGLVFHDKIRGFCPLFGSHHEFYGAMDFFYLNSFVGNFTPGLQNLYAGTLLNPYRTLEIMADYHFFAIATNLDYVKKPLGHEIEVSLSYTFANFVKLGAGYSFMHSTETMEILQRVSEKRRLHWGWLMLTVNPTIFTTQWYDKKKGKKVE